MLRFISRLSATLVLAVVLSGPAGAQEDKKVPEPKIEKIDPKKGFPGIEFDFPNFDELFKGVPLDAKQAEQLKKQLETAREQWRKAMERLKEDMKKGGAPGLPPGVFPPGGFPGAFPGGLPAFPPAFPGGGGPGIPGFPGMPGMPGEGRFGLQVESPSNILIEQLGLKENQGLVVVNVRPDSAATKAGLKANDILLEWGGKAVSNDPTDLKSMVDSTRDAVEVKVLRKGKTETLKGVTVPERKADPKRPRPKIDVRLPRLDMMRVARLDASFLRNIGLS